MRLGKREDELAEVNKCRRMNGLKEIKVGKRNCLRCGKEFESLDMMNNRICSLCSLINSEVFITGQVLSIGVDE